MRHTERTIKARAVECKKKQVQSLAELVSLAERISVLGGIDGGREPSRRTISRWIPLMLSFVSLAH